MQARSPLTLEGGCRRFPRGRWPPGPGEHWKMHSTKVKGENKGPSRPSRRVWAAIDFNRRTQRAGHAEDAALRARSCFLHAGDGPFQGLRPHGQAEDSTGEATVPRELSGGAGLCGRGAHSCLTLSQPPRSIHLPGNSSCRGRGFTAL